ncbi:MAG TPA: N-acetylneuraminate synthase family protein [Bacteroidales bacterium]|nr:N-acetylneuraminate synthase family protein [Bacteroidales bacterium]HPS15971.1 N-acetylneuraminate synthase family protein [Bacteroidales bacterium]
MNSNNNNFYFKNIDSVYLIAEIGINHNGNIDFVKKMIDYALVFGWNCVKLQKRNPDKSVPEHQKNIIKDTPWGKMTYLEYKHKMEFDKSQYSEIEKYCSDKIKFTASVWDIESVDFMDDFDVPFIKVPSAHLTNDDLIKYICKKKLPVLLSTGMSTTEEVDHAVELITSFTDNFALMHTNSSYPAHEEELNLNVIKTFQERYKCVVGYSGHEFGLVPTTTSVALGAKIIERHVTIDRTMWGTDQIASVEPQGMLKLVTHIRAIEKALGDGIKKVYDSELLIRKKLRGY